MKAFDLQFLVSLRQRLHEGAMVEPLGGERPGHRAVPGLANCDVWEHAARLWVCEVEVEST